MLHKCWYCSGWVFFIPFSKAVRKYLAWVLVLMWVIMLHRCCCGRICCVKTSVAVSEYVVWKILLQLKTMLHESECCSEKYVRWVVVLVGVSMLYEYWCCYEWVRCMSTGVNVNEYVVWILIVLLWSLGWGVLVLLWGSSMNAVSVNMLREC